MGEMEGWKGIQEGEDICIHIADSLHCTAEANIIVKNYIPIKKEETGKSCLSPACKGESDYL